MSSDENVFAKAAHALSRVEQVAVSGREITDTVKAAQASVQAASQELRTRGVEVGNRIDQAVREMQSVRSELLSARSELNAAVERLRESEGRAVAEIGKQVDLMRADAGVHVRSVRRLVWVALAVSLIGAAASLASLLVLAGVFAVK